MITYCAFLLLAAAIIATAVTRAVQIRKLGHILLQPFHTEQTDRNGISAFQAASTSLAATIGTGNIAGVAGAILLGGPGAIFWIWISGLFGMALKYIEVYLAMRYRQKSSDGQWRGGPMYLAEYGLGSGARMLGALFALFGMLVALGMGDLIQISTVAESMEAFYESLPCTNNVFANRILLRVLTGFLTAGLLYGILSGGIRRIGQITALLVPWMSFVYLLLCTVVLLQHSDRIGSTVSTILLCAFSPETLLGTGIGIGLRETFRTGISRGIFSHEAGLGTAAIAHSCADGTSAAAQARFGAFEVFFDMLICTVTGLVILVSDVPLPYGNADINSALVIDALASSFGKNLSASSIALSMLLFAFTSMTGFALYGSRCAEYLFGSGAVKPYFALFLLIAAFGPLLPRSVAWEFSELLNAYLCLPNLLLMGLILWKDRRMRVLLRK